MVPLAFGTFGRGQVEGHTMGLSKSLHLFAIHSSPVTGPLHQVALVAHEDAGHLLAQCVPPALVQPQGQATEAGRVGHIEDQYDGVHTAVVLLHHALAEALLTCSIPQLNLFVSE